MEFYRMTRHAAVLLALACLVGCGDRGGVNVLLVVLDTTRADAVSATGEPGTITPTLDALAREGVVYERARSTSAWTVPSHGSLFTGRYPSRHGARHGSPALHPAQQTLAELLRRTHDTGGFSENPHIRTDQGWAQGFGTYIDSWRWRDRVDTPPQTISMALDWLDRRPGGRPFFLFVNLMDAHLPYAPPPEWAERFVPPGADPETLTRLRGVGSPEQQAHLVGEAPIPERDFELLRGLYRAEVAWADYRVANLVTALRHRGTLDRTLVVVVADHGEQIGEHGLLGHQFALYESLLRVPLILRLPGLFEGGQRRDAPVQLVDVAPTVLEVVGVPRAEWPDMDGRSLISDAPGPDRRVVAEYAPPIEEVERIARRFEGSDTALLSEAIRSVQVGTLKLIARSGGAVELYDLEDDPGETRDLAVTRPDDVARLAEGVAFGSEVATGGEAEAAAIDAQTREALRALGYVE